MQGLIHTRMMHDVSTPRSLSKEKKQGVLRYLKKQATIGLDSELLNDSHAKHEASMTGTLLSSLKESPKPTPRRCVCNFKYS